jgi:hypothetical protein
MSGMSTTRHRITIPAVLANGLLVEIQIVERGLPRRASGCWLVSPREYESATRIYVSEDGESVLDNLMSRTGRPVGAYRAAVKEILPTLGLDGYKIQWSQKAGCSMCPCSPGFILKDPEGKRFRYEPETGPCDIWITISAGDLGESERRDVNIII